MFIYFYLNPFNASRRLFCAHFYNAKIHIFLYMAKKSVFLGMFNDPPPDSSLAIPSG